VSMHAQRVSVHATEEKHGPTLIPQSGNADDGMRTMGDTVNCLSELGDTGKTVFSATVRRSSFQVRVAAPAKGGLKSQSGCRP